MSFYDDIAKWTEKTEGRLHAVVRKVRYQVSEEIVKRTPVLTGLAKGGWQPSIGSPIVVDITPDFVYDEYPDVYWAGFDGSGIKTMQKINAVAKTEPYEIYYFTNNVRYVLDLEQGSSKQAPEGMMRVGIEAFYDALAEAKAEQYY